MKHWRRITCRRRGLQAWIAAAAIALASPALGGLVDSPVPNLNGQPATSVFYVTGVQSTPNYIDQKGLNTIFTCTSLETAASLTVAVEVFTYNGTGPVNPYIAAQTLPPRGSISIATGRVAGLLVGDMVDLPNAVPGGSARIISTSKKIMCSAVLTRNRPERDESEPEDRVLHAACNLPVVRNEQKGD